MIIGKLEKELKDIPKKDESFIKKFGRYCALGIEGVIIGTAGGITYNKTRDSYYSFFVSGVTAVICGAVHAMIFRD